MSTEKVIVLVEDFVQQKKRISITFLIARKKFSFALNYNNDSSVLFVRARDIFKLKANNKNVNFSTKFFLENISKRFGPKKSKVIYLKEHV